MTLVEIQRLINGTGSVTEVLETIDKTQEELERAQLMARLFREEEEIEKDQW
jgi:hypothetical protein